MTKLAVDEACCKANRRPEPHCSVQGVGEWRRRRDGSSSLQEYFPWAFSGCAPGKSDPTSTMVRLVCPWTLKARLAWGSRSPGSSSRQEGCFWNPHHPDGLVSPSSYYHFTTSDNNSAGNWVVWFLFSPLVFHFYSTVSHRYRVLWRHILHVVMFSSLVQNWKIKVAAEGSTNSKRCYLEIWGPSHSTSLGPFKASKA